MHAVSILVHPNFSPRSRDHKTVRFSILIHFHGSNWTNLVRPKSHFRSKKSFKHFSWPKRDPAFTLRIYPTDGPWSEYKTLVHAGDGPWVPNGLDSYRWFNFSKQINFISIFFHFIWFFVIDKFWLGASENNSLFFKHNFNILSIFDLKYFKLCDWSANQKLTSNAI